EISFRIDNSSRERIHLNSIAIAANVKRGRKRTRYRLPPDKSQQVVAIHVALADESGLIDSGRKPNRCAPIGSTSCDRLTEIEFSPPSGSPGIGVELPISATLDERSNISAVLIDAQAIALNLQGWRDRRFKVFYCGNDGKILILSSGCESD